MLRPVVAADLPALMAIRDRAGADALSDPALVTEADVSRLIAADSVVDEQSQSTLDGLMKDGGKTLD